jgi:hypothetical protein
MAAIRPWHDPTSMRASKGYALDAFLERRFVAPLILLVLTLLLFGDVLFSPQAIVLSSKGADISSLFVYWRDFSFSELRRGNLALWNPYIAGGYPYFASFQPALLYPLNAIYLFLPIAKAMNFDIALHTFLIGLFMWYWMRQRELRAPAALLAATILMLCGPFFLHVMPGHLTPLAVMAWAPLLFMACDGAVRRPEARYFFLGAFALAMQIVAGYPQYMVYTAVAIFLYSGLSLFKAPHPTRSAAMIGGIYVSGAALAAVQLWPGLAASAESVRGGGVSYQMASFLSLPPENFLTFLVPNFFGNAQHMPYWGGGYLWEMSLYIGVGGLALATYGLLRMPRRERGVLLLCIGVLLLMALGGYTPIFKYLYAHVPGFSSFRANAKFVFPIALLLALCAGYGFEATLPGYDLSATERAAGARARLILGSAALLLGLALLAAAVWVRASVALGTGGAWGKWQLALSKTRDIFLLLENYSHPTFVTLTGNYAAQQLVLGGVLCVLTALLFLDVTRRPRLSYAIGLLTALELVIFARTHRPTFDLAQIRRPVLEEFAASHRDDYRFLKNWFGNEALGLRKPEVGGYDPFVLRRYAELMYFTQGLKPDEASAYFFFTQHHRLYQMLHCRYVVLNKDDPHIGEVSGALPHVLLVPEYSVLRGRDKIFAAMDKKSFDPRRTAILEEEPQPKPDKSATGTAKVLEEGTDYLTLEAQTDKPTLLLVTDNYSEGWKARGLEGSVQREYSVLPANYVLRAIPLQAGHHRIRLEYRPDSFIIGKWISIMALLAYLSALGWWQRGTRRALPEGFSQNENL